MATFTAPALERKPDQICVGKIVEVADAYVGKSGKYYVVPISLEALDAGRNQKVYWLFRPEWLTVLGKADLQRIKDEDSGAYFVYSNNIATQEENKQSVLRGLAVTQEAFDEIASRLIDLGIEAVTETPTLVSDALRTFFVDERGDTLVGYVLTQQTEKTDEVNPETGKPIYVPTKYLEVASYFDGADEKALAKMEKKAEKNPSRFRMTYAGCPV